MADVLRQLLFEGDWLKLSRVAGSLGEAARVSPLHAWFVAETLQDLVAHAPEWRTELHHVLSLLLELLTDLVQPLNDSARDRLAALRLTGKAGKTVRSLLALESSGPSPKTTAACEQACVARLARAERWSTAR